jgi:hypothetical protein
MIKEGPMRVLSSTDLDTNIDLGHVFSYVCIHPSPGSDVDGMYNRFPICLGAYGGVAEWLWYDEDGSSFLADGFHAQLCLCGLGHPEGTVRDWKDLITVPQECACTKARQEDLEMICHYLTCDHVDALAWATYDSIALGIFVAILHVV